MSKKLGIDRILILIKEIQETEEQFQDLITYRHWIPYKNYEKRRKFLEYHLGMLYRDLMKLVEGYGLWHLNVDKNTMNFTFWRGK